MPRERQTFHSWFDLISLVGNREPRFIPRRHTTSKDTHRGKAVVVQYLRRSHRAAFFVSDSDDGVQAMSRQAINLALEFG